MYLISALVLSHAVFCEIKKKLHISFRSKWRMNETVPSRFVVPSRFFVAQSRLVVLSRFIVPVPCTPLRASSDVFDGSY